MIKLIFLDIDGVLNSNRYMKSPQYFDETKDYDPRGMEIINKAHHTHLNPEAVRLVNLLVDKTGAEVILSSTWRNRYSIDEMNAMLSMRGATFKIVGITPVFFSFRGRGGEIKDFLEDLDGEITFVILDDINQFHDYGFDEQFIQTTEEDGLTMAHIERAIKVLNG
ncbi:hypothetical protein UFOVP1290_292 [uncultured Caudovirales phage]|uniref:Uncharacterized protein n=1 Tax=uncultured Caudovirales phage TaxID=2100421 RepID=A0A6J5RL24_9CAUD|nr:hypothetical protein UFOVP1290_292 [uncultured Caudovirales phage]